MSDCLWNTKMPIQLDGQFQQIVVIFKHEQIDPSPFWAILLRSFYSGA